MKTNKRSAEVVFVNALHNTLALYKNILPAKLNLQGGYVLDYEVDLRIVV